MRVIKRDGRRVGFDSNKIRKAVEEAFRDIDGELDHYAIQKSAEIAERAEEHFKDVKSINIEDVQNFVEECLMATKRKDVAKQYILYRNQRTIDRERNSKIRKIIKEKVSAQNVQNQNANVDEHSFGGRMGEANSAVMKELALDEYVSPMAKENHLNNRIYIHDLDAYVVGEHNCLSIPFDNLLANGFNTRQTDVRPAQSINTAFQLLAVIFQLQSLQQFGGVSATHLDWTMVPYVRKSFYKHYKEVCSIVKVIKAPSIEKPEEVSIKDKKYTGNKINLLRRYVYRTALKLTQKELDQSTEGLYHNLNTLQSRSGNQLPFTSINYGTCTLEEGRMVTKSLLDSLLKGVGKFNRTSIFPCGIFQCMNKVNRKKGDPNYDLFRLALKCTAVRLYPNYANCDWSGNAGYDINDPKTYFSTMGKRRLSSCKIF